MQKYLYPLSLLLIAILTGAHIKATNEPPTPTTRITLTVEDTRATELDEPISKDPLPQKITVDVMKPGSSIIDLKRVIFKEYGIPLNQQLIGSRKSRNLWECYDGSNQPIPTDKKLELHVTASYQVAVSNWWRTTTPVE